MRRRRGVIWGLLLILSGCSNDTDLETAREKWASAAILDYQYTLRKECFCNPDSPDGAGYFDIVVEDGAVVSAHNRNTGADYTAEQVPNLPTVDGLFDILQSAYDNGADQVLVQYDGTYGYPISIDIDRIAGAADDEVSYEVTQFQP